MAGACDGELLVAAGRWVCPGPIDRFAVRVWTLDEVASPVMSEPAAHDHDHGHDHGQVFGEMGSRVTATGEYPGERPGEPPVILDPLPEGVRVRSHPEIRTLLLTSEELTAWLLDQRTGGVRQLNQAAAAVWALIEEPVTLAVLGTDLADTFELEPAIAEEVVGAAVDALRAEDLLEVTDADGSVIPGHGDAGAASGEADGPHGDAGAASGEADGPHGDAGAASGEADGPDGDAGAASGEADASASGRSAADDARLPALLTRAPDP